MAELQKTNMQDITPPYNRVRGKIKPLQRSPGFEMRPSRVYEEIYSRTRIVNATYGSLQDSLKAGISNRSSSSLPLSLQIELNALLSDPNESETITIEKVEVFESRSTPVLTPEKELIMDRVRQIVREEQKRAKFRGLFSKRNVITAMAILFIATTGYVTVDTWITNNTVKAEASKLVGNDSTEVATDGVASKEHEGRDETQPTQASLANYVVGPTLPRALYIDKLQIASRVLPMGINTDGSIQAPRNIYDAGWYNGSVKPGEIGAMFIDGHASGPTREGLFAYLEKLAKGDTLQVETGDGTWLNYKVVHTEVQPLDGLDMKRMLLPYGNALKGLNLMTCTGKWDDEKQSYDQRVLIFTEQI